MTAGAGPGFALTPEQAASFDSQHPIRFVRVSGPLTVLRLVGEQEGEMDREYKLSSSYGVYWFSSRFFWNILDELTNNVSGDVGAQHINNLIRMIVRDKTAVSLNWNAFQFVATLNLPKGQSLDAWVGKAKPQPLNQPGSLVGRARGPGPILKGQGYQYVIDSRAQKTTLREYISTDLRPFWISGISHLNVRQ
jgi:hypothetical protein